MSFSKTIQLYIFDGGNHARLRPLARPIKATAAHIEGHLSLAQPQNHFLVDFYCRISGNKF